MTFAPTPQYVLLEDGKPLSARIASPLTGTDSSMIYAFSDKEPYDRFCASTGRAVCPYPLVKGFLRRQVAERPASEQYMVLDANSPNENEFQIASMAAILQSLEDKARQVSIVTCDSAPIEPSTS